MATFNVGDAVPLVYAISAAATVTLTVTAPDGTTSTPSLTQSGSAPAVTYTANVAATQAGLWLYRFAATGAVTDAEDGQFFVAAIAAATVYTTVHELKAALALAPTDTADDHDLQDAIRAASRAIDADCERHFYKTAEARMFQARDPWRLQLGAFNDLVSATSVKTDEAGDGTFETTWAASDYQLLCADGTPNVNAGPEPRPYAQLRAVGGRPFPTAVSWTGWTGRTHRVEVTGTWGWAAVPDAVRRACRLLAAEQFKLREAPFGVAGFGDLGLIRVRDNPKAMRLLAPYLRHPFKAA